MPEQISNLLIITGALCLLVLFWVLSIVLVYWDIARRQVRTLELVAWVALVALLPLIGLLAYLFYRLLGLFISPSRRTKRKHRETMLKTEPGEKSKSSTIAAIVYAKHTRTEMRPSDVYRTESGQGAVGNESPVAEIISIGLTVTEGSYRGKEFVIYQLPAIIGRGPDAGISLDEDLGISRQHAEIYKHAGIIRIRDLNSTHGTQVNDFGISDKGLDSGDKIQVGKTVMVIDIEVMGYGEEPR